MDWTPRGWRGRAAGAGGGVCLAYGVSGRGVAEFLKTRAVSRKGVAEFLKTRTVSRKSVTEFRKTRAVSGKSIALSGRVA